jgi:hypothetical protein
LRYLPAIRRAGVHQILPLPANVRQNLLFQRERAGVREKSLGVTAFSHDPALREPQDTAVTEVTKTSSPNGRGLGAAPGPCAHTVPTRKPIALLPHTGKRA